jgi:hypothetical protein
MKRTGFTFFAVAALALPLGAQVNKSLRADIPFEFVVQNTTVPAGECVVTFQTGSVVDLLVGGHHFEVVAQSNGPDRSLAESKLVFRRYGDQHFLSHIATTSTSRDIPMSRRERELKKATAVAGLQMQTEIVLATR